MINKGLHILLLSALVALGLGGCASKPVMDETGVDKSISPARAAQEPALRGQLAQWGGVLISTRNLKDKTQLEILTYPLDDRGQPDRNAQPLGRVLALKDGYVEALDYPAGTLVTAVGAVAAPESGKIGDADYNYPVIQVKQLHRWPAPAERQEPRVRFGIGVGIGL